MLVLIATTARSASTPATITAATLSMVVKIFHIAASVPLALMEEQQSSAPFSQALPVIDSERCASCRA
ncbi:hypothetical protein ACXX9E_28510 [Pseudomonas sp. GNP014]